MCDQDNPVFLIPERSPESLPDGALRQTLLALRTLESIGARNLHLPRVICLGSEDSKLANLRADRQARVSIAARPYA
jgi:hypothetical protein